MAGRKLFRGLMLVTEVCFSFVVVVVCVVFSSSSSMNFCILPTVAPTMIILLMATGGPVENLTGVDPSILSSSNVRRHILNTVRSAKRRLPQEIIGMLRACVFDDIHPRGDLSFARLHDISQFLLGIFRVHKPPYLYQTSVEKEY
jgi:hypothetical protein